MSTLSNSLLEFILGLLKDDKALREFDENPEKFMLDAGYGDCGSEAKDYANMLRDYSPGHGAKVMAARDHGPHADYQAVKTVTEHHHHAPAVTNVQHGPTEHHENNMYGDEYKIWNDDGAVAVGGGVAVGEDGTIRNSDIDTHANRVQNSGDGSQVAGEDADAEDDAFQNSGNDVSGGSNFVAEAGDGDLDEPATASGGSMANSGKIDHSTSDDDVIIKDNELHVNDVTTVNGDSQVESPHAEQENEGLLVLDNVELGGGLRPPTDGPFETAVG